MCVMCAACIPKHIASRCPTEIEESISTWPSMCYKCKPFIPIHDHVSCPNVKTLIPMSESPVFINDPVFDPSRLVLSSRPNSFQNYSNLSNRSRFKPASDASVEGTTFRHQKSRKVFNYSKAFAPPTLPPMSSFTETKQKSYGLNYTTQGQNAYSNIDTQGEYTLSTNEKTEKYTTKLNFDIFNKERSKKRSPNCKEEKKRIPQDPPTITAYICSSSNEDSQFQPDSCQQVIWNDLSLVYPQDSTPEFNLENTKVYSHKQANEDLDIDFVEDQTFCRQNMDSDSEAELYTSDDEEDVLITSSSGPSRGSNHFSEGSAALRASSLYSKVNSPSSLSQKALSIIYPIDNTKKSVTKNTLAHVVGKDVTSRKGKGHIVGIKNLVAA